MFRLDSLIAIHLLYCIVTIQNDHHPKSGEVIQFHVCEESRAIEDQSSFWQLY